MASSAKRTLSIEARLRDRLSRPLGKMDKALTKFALGTVVSFKAAKKSLFSFKSLLVATAGVLGAYQVGAFVRSTAEQEASLLRLAETTGDNVENLSELQAALVLTGSKADGFADDVRTVNQQVRSALSGNREILRGFTDLGLTLEDLRTLSPSGLFEEMARGLDKFTTAQEKEAALGKILPERFQQLLPILGRGFAQFQQTVREARDAGATVTVEQAKVAERLERSLAKFDIALGSLGQQLLDEFGPDAIALFDLISKKLAGNSGEISAIARAIGSGVVSAVGLAVDAVIGLVRVIESIPGVNLLNKTDEELAQIRELEEAVQQLSQSFLFLSKERQAAALAFADSNPGESYLELLKKELSELGGGGLAGQMEELRRNLQAEFDKTIQSLGDGGSSGPTTDPESTAKMIGLPNSAAITAYGESLRDALKNVPIQDVGGQGDSVFNQPTNTGNAVGTNSASQADALRVQLQQLQQIVALAPGLDDIAQRLAGLQANSAIAELSAAQQAGVISADELAFAIERVNLQLDRAKNEIGVGNFWDGFSQSTERAISEWTDFEKAGTEAAQSLITNGLDTVVSEVGAGIARTQEWGDAWSNIKDQILSAISQIIAKLITLKAIQAGISLFGGGDSSGGGTSPVTLQQTATSGATLGPSVVQPSTILAPGPQRGGGTYVQNVTLQVSALDARSVQQMFTEQKGLLGALVAKQMASQVPFRQTVQQVTA